MAIRAVMPSTKINAGGTTKARKYVTVEALLCLAGFARFAEKPLLVPRDGSIARIVVFVTLRGDVLRMR